MITGTSGLIATRFSFTVCHLGSWNKSASLVDSPFQQIEIDLLKALDFRGKHHKTTALSVWASRKRQRPTF
jgi:hypothetical protein